MVKADEIEKKREIENFEIFNTYLLDKYEYYVGFSNIHSKDYDEYGLRFYVFNHYGQKIFASKGGGDEMGISLKFFKSQMNTDTIIILAHAGAETTWGNTVYIQTNDEIIRIGHIDIGGLNDINEYYADSIDISEFIEIKRKGDQIEFRFNCNSVFLIDEEKTLGGDETYYQYDGNKFEFILK